jgi:hypothetical protein
VSYRLFLLSATGGALMFFLPMALYLIFAKIEDNMALTQARRSCCAFRLRLQRFRTMASKCAPASLSGPGSFSTKRGIVFVAAITRRL